MTGLVNTTEQSDRTPYEKGAGPRVSVLIPCRNEIDFIQSFIDDLRGQQMVAGGAEYLFIDGGSDDGTDDIITHNLSAFGAARLLHNSRRFVSPGLNLGIQEARGEIIVRMDVHTSYADDYVASCVEVLEETGAQNVGGAARTRPEGYWSRAIAAAYGSSFAVGQARFHFPDYEGPVDTVTYGCWRRETLVELGGFDEHFIRNQDDELNLRITRAGGQIWQSAKIRSWYHPRGSLTRLFRQYYQYGYWKVAVIRKHHLPASWRHLVPMALVSSLLALMIGAAIFPPLAALLLAEVVFYLLFIVGGSVWIARQSSWDLLLALPITLSSFHMAYGIGFLQATVFGTKSMGHFSASKLTR
jgi:glycosyltransferase involved in cell wall biosynthesis